MIRTVYKFFIFIFGAPHGFADVSCDCSAGAHFCPGDLSLSLSLLLSEESPVPPGPRFEPRTIFATCLSVPDRLWCQLRFLSGPLPPKQHSNGSERSEHGALIYSKQIIQKRPKMRGLSQKCTNKKSGGKNTKGRRIFKGVPARMGLLGPWIPFSCDTITTLNH